MLDEMNDFCLILIGMFKINVVWVVVCIFLMFLLVGFICEYFDIKVEFIIDDFFVDIV